MCLFLHTLTENFLWCNHFFPEILAEMTQDLTSLFYRSFASAIFLNSPPKKHSLTLSIFARVGTATEVGEMESEQLSWEAEGRGWWMANTRPMWSSLLSFLAFFHPFPPNP